MYRTGTAWYPQIVPVTDNVERSMANKKIKNVPLTLIRSV